MRGESVPFGRCGGEMVLVGDIWAMVAAGLDTVTSWLS